ncbi:hypothetical protein BC833DRAFT_593602 [Globomyces pollinis-pini]|nr:hypothetical protein BC833DRAFT_593602 [Globomyces pollinis-pini]
MPNSLLLVNIATNILSALSLAISLLLDIKNRKTYGLSNPNGIFGVIMRIAFFIWNILSPIVLNHAEKYVVEGASIAEQRIGITSVFCILQMAVSLGVMCLFAIFFYYWISMSALLPKSKLVAIPIFVAVYYLVYLIFFFGPLLIWKGQLLQYSFWRPMCQAAVQILLECFLVPVLFYFIYALFTYIASKSTVGNSGGTSMFDNVSQALIRIICTNILLIIYLALAPATLLVLDNQLPQCPLAPQAFLNLTGFSVSLIYLGKYIVVKKSLPLSVPSRKKSATTHQVEYRALD